MGPTSTFTIELEQIVGTADRLVSIHHFRGKGAALLLWHRSRIAQLDAYLWTFREREVIHFVPRVSRSSRGPRSRRAVGVGDVAGERGGRPPRVRATGTPVTSMVSFSPAPRTWSFMACLLFPAPECSSATTPCALRYAKLVESFENLRFEVEEFIDTTR